jgi:hypothetical protein
MKRKYNLIPKKIEWICSEVINEFCTPGEMLNVGLRMKTVKIQRLEWRYLLDVFAAKAFSFSTNSDFNQAHF